MLPFAPQKNRAHREITRYTHTRGIEHKPRKARNHWNKNWKIWVKQQRSAISAITAAPTAAVLQKNVCTLKFKNIHVLLTSWARCTVVHKNNNNTRPTHQYMGAYNAYAYHEKSHIKILNVACCLVLSLALCSRIKRKFSIVINANVTWSVYILYNTLTTFLHRYEALCAWCAAAATAAITANRARRQKSCARSDCKRRSSSFVVVVVCLYCHVCFWFWLVCVCVCTLC